MEAAAASAADTMLETAKIGKEMARLFPELQHGVLGRGPSFAPVLLWLLVGFSGLWFLVSDSG